MDNWKMILHPSPLSQEAQPSLKAPVAISVKHPYLLSYIHSIVNFIHIYSTLQSPVKEAFMRIITKWRFMTIKKVLKILHIHNLTQMTLWNVAQKDEYCMYLYDWLTLKPRIYNFKWGSAKILNYWLFILIRKNAYYITSQIKSLWTIVCNIICFNILVSWIANVRSVQDYVRSTLSLHTP